MIDRFPRDAPKARVPRAFGRLGFTLVREGNHLSLRGTRPDGLSVALTLPNHRNIKGATLRAACTQCGIDRQAFTAA
ncbi:type II toxin-antitoxin system HicA family toxin [bacterium]|nr:type II toxin-antitoxin system HicA family toxin [bacterium]